MAKRKRSAAAAAAPISANIATSADEPLPVRKRGRNAGTIASSVAAVVNSEPILAAEVPLSRRGSRAKASAAVPEPQQEAAVVKGEDDLSAKPKSKRKSKADTGVGAAPAKKASKLKQKAMKKADSITVKEGIVAEPEADDEGEADGIDTGKDTTDAIAAALARPPAVNSDYVPLPWKGRLGFACLNTYLRTSRPPIFCSRTCRIASIIEHRHPLKDPSQPEHATKNRPDKEQPADVERGRRWVEALCLANVRDIAPMIRWNDKYGIRFLRLSSEMFPFASHEEYGYKLAPFAAKELEKAGKVINELGHRVSMHPGQFTQLGSPRPSVIKGAFRDLEYHDELLSLLKLSPQQNRDAVLILHMGGTFGDKAATLGRFRENYAKLSESIKARLVLENDDVSWSVHELLPVCQELNIPLVLDYHHHNIIFDADKCREGTLDIMNYYDEIAETWRRKGIKQKMHYSEPTDGAITGRQRRKHRPRVLNMPPCAQDMDLMIEAKDKEQAVFELMRKYKLPGYERIGDIVPHVRTDENVPAPARRGGKKSAEKEETPPPAVPDEEIGMGGPEGRVYWPPEHEEWLTPVKRVVKKKTDAETADNNAAPTPESLSSKKKKKKTAVAPKTETPISKEPLKSKGKKATTAVSSKAVKMETETQTAAAAAPRRKSRAKAPTAVPTPSTSETGSDAEPDYSDMQSEAELESKPRASHRPVSRGAAGDGGSSSSSRNKAAMGSRRVSGRAVGRVSYVEAEVGLSE